MKNLIYFSLLSFFLLCACDVIQIEEETPILNQAELEFAATEDSYDEETLPTKTTEANFTVDNNQNTLLEKETLLLTNNSINAVSYHWDFGNGVTSTEAIPEYKYQIHGYRTVTLTITDAQGNSHATSKEILVLCLYGGGDHDQ